MADLANIKKFINKEPNNAGNTEMSELIEIRDTTLPNIQDNIEKSIAAINKIIDEGVNAYSTHYNEKLDNMSGGKPTRRRRAPRRGKKLGGKSRRCKK